jgi:toxin HigB-1
MEVQFSDDKLRQLCEEEKKMNKKFGAKVARALKARLADLDAAEQMTDVRRGRPHPLKGSYEGCLGLTLSGGTRLVLESVEQPPPTKPDGGIDWSNVRSVRIVFIGDYHD